MSLKNLLIQELQMEVANTEKMFSRIPENQFGWKPHDKSYTLKHLSVHIANMFGWITTVFPADELNLEQIPLNIPEINTVAELIAFLKEMETAALKTLETMTEADFDKQWALRRGDVVFFQMNKYMVIRQMIFNHIYHHRGQLSVYLRLLNVPIPGMYGPSADEQM
jgi:uncharacterized damage-inducible protein DinB